LKRHWEEALPVKVYLSDRVQGAGARDLWADIASRIVEANLAIFDITSFRSHVILELGYALALKRAEQVVICRDLTPSGKRGAKVDEWQLSDIPHLFRIEYKKFERLDTQLVEHVERMAPVRRFYRLVDEIRRHRSWPTSAYVAVALEALKELRDNGPVGRKDFTRRLKHGGIADVKKMENLFKRFALARPGSGTNGLWKLID